MGALMLFAPFTPAQAKDFVLVIDAGHGGHDDVVFFLVAYVCEDLSQCFFIVLFDKLNIFF